MDKHVLLALLERWEREQVGPDFEDGSEQNREWRAESRGVRKGIAGCAEDLRHVIRIFADFKS